MPRDYWQGRRTDGPSLSAGAESARFLAEQEAALEAADASSEVEDVDARLRALRAAVERFVRA